MVVGWVAWVRAGELPGEIREGLEKQAQGMGKITVRWETAVEPKVTIKEYRRLIAPDKLSGAEATDFASGEEHGELSWQGDGRFVESLRYTVKKKDKPHAVKDRMRYAFDGKMFYIAGANPEESHSVTRIYPVEEEGEPAFHASYFEWIGVHLPVQPTEIARGERQAQSWLLMRLDLEGGKLESVEKAVIDGNDVTRVRIREGEGAGENNVMGCRSIARNIAVVDEEGCVENYYLDPKMGYAIRRFESFDTDGLLRYQIDFADLTAVKGTELVLPRTCVFSDFVPDGGNGTKLVRKVTMRVKEVDRGKLEDGVFVLKDTTPGTWIIDHYGEQQKIHIVQKDGSLRLKKRVQGTNVEKD